MLGPLWVIMSPTLFIATLGLLYAQVGNSQADAFIPHLTVGLVVWTLISGFVTGSTTVFQRGRSQILQGGMQLIDIASCDVLRTIVQFLHQVIIVVAVFLVYSRELSLHSLVAILGFLVIVLNGAWLTTFLGILGARYRDLTEIVSAVMRIAFLATPIIWMPSPEGEGGIMGAFLTYNPFYHFIETIRTPLLGGVLPLESWIVVLSFTVIGPLITWHTYRYYKNYVALWV